jgi:hypothetical protein
MYLRATILSVPFFFLHGTVKAISLFIFMVKIYGSVSQNKDGTAGFTFLIVSEDNSLVLVEQLNAASPGMISGQRDEN